MIATQVDSQRRATLPLRFSPSEPITINDLDENTVVIRRVSQPEACKLVLIPVWDTVADDPEMDEFGEAISRDAFKQLPAFEAL